MKQSLKIGFITTVSGRWPRELPYERHHTYSAWLVKSFPQIDWIIPDSVVDSTEKIEQTIHTMKAENADLILMLYGAFTGDDVSCALAEQLCVPLILWAPREPELNGDRLLSNAMVALNMNSASLHRLGYISHPIYGNKESPEIESRLRSIITAYDVIKKMKHTLFGLFGYRPTAFYNSAFDEGLIRRTFGIRIEETDLKTVFDTMETQSSDAVASDQKLIRDRFRQDSTNPREHYENHSRLYLALKEIVKEQGYDFSAIKCWPEMGNLHATPCAVLGRLADDNIPIACEGDVDAALAMVAETYIACSPCFITDMIDMNEDENNLIFWHCGNAAPSLHDANSPHKMGNHPLAGQGTAFYAPLKEGPVTIARFCNINGRYKLFLLSGTAVKTNLYTPGCMVTVSVNTPVKQIVYGMMEEGIPHHYSIVWADIEEQMKMVAKLLNIEIISFTKM